jgi:hypothetical protein
MNEKSPAPSTTSHAIIILATGLLVISSPWTLQAFVPEPYFLRTPDQLRIMSTPNGFGTVERSLLPFYSTIGIELAALLAVGVIGWRSRNATTAIGYLLAILVMASITLLRLTQEFQGPM